MEYTAVIRTLGKAGDKYQQTLDSLCRQTIQPKDIIVYIAEGYEIPKETCGREKYIYVKKGMVAQRALKYEEVDTEYMLFLDDDVYLPENGVENLYNALIDNNAEIISPDVFDNSSRTLKNEIIMTLSGRIRARRHDRKWAYKVMRTGGYSYNKRPTKDVYLSQSNAGPCFFCRKKDFLKIKFEEELWIDRFSYPIGEDQIMFYKMYLAGLKQLTVFGTDIKHLDSGSTLANKDKERLLVNADFFNKRVFFTRFIIEPETSALKRLWSHVCYRYFVYFSLTASWLKREKEIYKIKTAAIKSAEEFIKSSEYKTIPKISKK